MVHSRVAEKPPNSGRTVRSTSMSEEKRRKRNEYAAPPPPRKQFHSAHRPLPSFPPPAAHGRRPFQGSRRRRFRRRSLGEGGARVDRAARGQLSPSSCSNVAPAPSPLAPVGSTSLEEVYIFRGLVGARHVHAILPAPDFACPVGGRAPFVVRDTLVSRRLRLRLPVICRTIPVAWSTLEHPPRVPRFPVDTLGETLSQRATLFVVEVFFTERVLDKGARVVGLVGG